MTRPRRASTAFTLVELVLVLALMALLMAAVAPQLRGFGRGRAVDNAADEFLAATRFARSEAVSSAVPHRVELSSGGDTFQVTRLDGAEYVAVAGEFGKGEPLPTGVRIDVERADGSDAGVLEFFPNGTASPATVLVSSADTNRVVTLRAVGIADPFRREPVGGAP